MYKTLFVTMTNDSVKLRIQSGNKVGREKEGTNRRHWEKSIFGNDDPAFNGGSSTGNERVKQVCFSSILLIREIHSIARIVLKEKEGWSFRRKNGFSSGEKEYLKASLMLRVSSWTK